MAYKPAQRQVSCTVLTTAGWLEGTFHVNEKAQLVDQLDAVEEFYKLTDASMVGIETSSAFFALQRDAVVLVLPPEGETTLQTRLADSRPEQIFCLLDGVVIRGTVRLRKGVRLSDFVTRQDGMLLLEACTMHIGPVLGQPQSVTKHHAIVVNVNHLIGISETTPV